MGELVVWNGMGEGLQLMLGDLRMHAGVTEPVFLIFAICVVTVSELVYRIFLD